MPLISKTLENANGFRKQFGLQTNEAWSEMSENVLLIRENNVTLEFTTMNGSTVVKQADVVLVTYPLDYTRDYGVQEALSDLDYVSPVPPAFSQHLEERSLTESMDIYSTPINNLRMGLQ